LEKCIHCDQLILEKIRKSDATRCQLLKLKCTKFDYRWSAGCSSDPLAAFKGPTTKGRKGEEGGEGMEREGDVKLRRDG